MKHHVIYVPGIGDQHTYGQDIAVKYWRFFGLRGHYFPLGWRKVEGFTNKLTRLTDKIDDLTKQGHKVSLCGTSAGASAVLAAYALRPNINGVITIAGKIYRPEAISSRIGKANPDFIEAAKLIQGNLNTLSDRGNLENILCLYAHSDKVVPPKDAIIIDAKSKQVPGMDHASAIFSGILLGAPTMARFLKSR